jgi:hypothetical protein
MRREPRENGRRVRHVFEDGEEENSFEGSLADEQRRRPAAGNVPFEEISLRESLPLSLEDVRIPVAADVGLKAARQVREAAAHVEDAPGPRDVRERDGETSLAHTPGQEAVER